LPSGSTAVRFKAIDADQIDFFAYRVPETKSIPAFLNSPQHSRLMAQDDELKSLLRGFCNKERQ
jgi:hypothetical protein